MSTARPLPARVRPGPVLPALVRPALVLSALLLAPPALAHAEEDRWFAPDKYRHFGVSAGLAGAGYAGGALLFGSREARLATGAGLALSVGLAKEVYDHSTGRGFLWRDMAWNVAGTAAGLALSYALDRFVLTPLLAPRPAPAR